MRKDYPAIRPDYRVYLLQNECNYRFSNNTILKKSDEDSENSCRFGHIVLNYRGDLVRAA